MQEWVPAVTMLGLALIIGTALVLRGPMGKALAEWIRGWSKTDEQWLAFKAAKQGVTLRGDPERLRAEMDERRDRRRRAAGRGRRAQAGPRRRARSRAAGAGGTRGAGGFHGAAAREEPRRRAARAAEGLMNAPELGVLIPIIAVGGFFGWMI